MTKFQLVMVCFIVAALLIRIGFEIGKRVK